MSYFDFDREATVSWSDKPVFGDIHGGPGNVRPFKTLRDTLVFVESLAPHLRKTAFVMTDSTNYSGTEIDDLLERLKQQAR
ncbi:hypothetical protein IZ6_04900 [Terrihabitans soli]|uniref:Uncharacterized protein n=1 Tax=Terrihabitans soli TaxID=708113 RepID=A0A6S6QPP5_9HYPH|nr:hypothetical protein [Terrihabitans soli]BCJ89755.1 hypothetical protein IZ6_04900 [Terrihabitans soli]